MPTQAVRLPESLVSFLKSLAVDLDKKLFLVDESQLPEDAIYSLLDRLSSSKLENLHQRLVGEGRVKGLIDIKRAEEKEEERKRDYRVEINVSSIKTSISRLSTKE